MHILRAGILYFLIVFGTGFVLGIIRVSLLVPRFGERAAELAEMPLMLAVIAWASRRLARGNPLLSRYQRLAAGGIALLLLAAAELLLVVTTGNQSIGQYIASRDPVSGTAYLLSLVVFAIAPALWSGRPLLRDGS